MFERFTAGARRAVVLAQEEARRLRHRHVGAEHMLLGVLRSEQGAGPAALAELGVTLTALRAAVEQVSSAGRAPPQGHIPFTPAAKKAMERSLREAMQHGAAAIDTGHVLLALLDSPQRPDDPVSAVLAGSGIDPRDVVAAIERQLGPQPTPPPAASRPDQLNTIEHMLVDVLDRLERIEARLDEPERP